MHHLAGALAVFVVLTGKATSKYCDGKYFCDPPKQCCTLGCCYLYAPPSPNLLSLIFWNHWYLWCAVAVAVMCGCGCGLWKRKSRPNRPQSEPPTPDSFYHPPNYSRCSSFHQPPPYAEVTSKPDLYPLVISYSENGKTGGNYLMVQYFRNYIMRPVGSLSATSTADSLSSSLFCSAANEANSLIPPPYSSAPGSVEQINAQTAPSHEILPCPKDTDSCMVRLESERRQARPSLCGLSNVSSVTIAPLDSPPQATTPTLGKLLHHGNGRNKYLGKGWLSRSAPTTPSTQLAPASSFESSPLLAPDQDNTF
ncbi:uncharacterized protein [Halyomorpha halys]|uniref:uncharacterized protein isoform X2 n=1 Tax=Halyomorpha halys TaxID=286706 RepID=UPI0006D51EFC|nr:uncharacterized protein LOC106687947 isoform X3 [Halyomorpha halys]